MTHSIVPAAPSSRTVFLAAIALLAFVSAAWADVFFVGSVNPDPPAAGGTFPSTSTLIVGDENDTNSADPRAYLSVDDGTLLQYGQLIVGNDENFVGEVRIDGDFLAGKNTQFNFSGQGSTGDPTVQIGYQGTGFFRIGGGSTMNVLNNSGNFAIGVDTTGIGYATVTDPWTIVTVEDNVFVGQEGIGTLNILNGAQVVTLDRSSNKSVTIGSTATGIGTVVVDGLGSILNSASSLIVGATIAGTPTTHGQGTLQISSSGVVQVNQGITPLVNVGRLGRIELSGGTLLGFTPATGSGINVSGYLGGGGLVRGTVAFTGDSTWGANFGQVLIFTNNVINQGAATIEAGEVRFQAGFTNNAAVGATPPGRITLEDGTVRFAQPLTNNGIISSASGATNIHGSITNQGFLVVARDTVATFNDSVNNTTGTITVLPGGNALFLANLTFTSMSTLNLGVAAINLTGTSGQIGSNGVATLAGTLAVNTEVGYSPTLGDSFELLRADGGIVGTFDTVTLPTIPGTLEYQLLYGPTSVRMEVALESTAVALGGDYNNDGIVDALDYTLWRNHLGQLVTLPNDTTPGEVTAADYEVWKANYGESLFAGAGGLEVPVSNQVPEPSFLLLVAVAGGMAWASCGRRSPRSVV